MSETITITYGNSAENHVRNQILHANGNYEKDEISNRRLMKVAEKYGADIYDLTEYLRPKDLRKIQFMSLDIEFDKIIKKYVQHVDKICFFYEEFDKKSDIDEIEEMLRKSLKDCSSAKNKFIDSPFPEIPEVEDAFICIFKNGISLAGADPDEMFDELTCLKWDTKALMRGRVVNKKARHNLIFDKKAQEADYESGKGTVVPYKQVPNLNAVRKFWQEEFNVNLIAEGNRYYDKNCYIGYHGDTERKIVIAARIGADFPLYYQWYYRFKPFGLKFEINIGHGDVYVMSKKAVGTDWKSSSKLTLRHAAGAV